MHGNGEVWDPMGLMEMEMEMEIRPAMGWEWDGNGNEVHENGNYRIKT